MSRRPEAKLKEGTNLQPEKQQKKWMVGNYLKYVH